MKVSSGFENQIQVVWFDPTGYDPLRHGPPYLPELRDIEVPSPPKAMKLASKQREQVWHWVKQAQVADVAEVLRGFAQEYESDFAWLAALLVAIRAASMIHQSHHWRTKGGHFYADHLLFERLYNDSQEHIDRLAERTVGLGAPPLVEPIKQADQIGVCVRAAYASISGDFPVPDFYAVVSLQKEYRVLEAVRVVRAALEQSGNLTDGTDNLLQDLADKHEEFVYLLKQRVSGTSYSYAR